MKLSQAFLFFFDYGVGDGDTRFSRLKEEGGSLFSSLIELPLTRSFQGESGFFGGFVDSTGGRIGAAKSSDGAAMVFPSTPPSSIAGTITGVVTVVAASILT